MTCQKASEAGFLMPAEWTKHERTWMGWPDRTDNWKENAEPAQHAYAEVICAISRFEPVTLCVNLSQVENARRLIPAAVNIEVLEQDDAWFRDSGPTFVRNSRGEVAGIDWDFNGWGKDVLPSIDNDIKIADWILSKCSIEAFKPGIVMEGGSFHVDGEGTLLTTEECLLNRNRNPGLSKDQIEQHLRDSLGVEKIIWLPNGLIADEDTNGHIDNFACFSAPGKVLLSWPSVDDDHEQLGRSEAALRVLENETDAKGRKFEVTKLYLPPPLYYSEEDVKSLDVTNNERLANERLAASYVNFYICNEAVICPAFGGQAQETDIRAQKGLKEAFPDREIVVIQRARDILLGGGNIHCITQQQPVSYVALEKKSSR